MDMTYKPKIYFTSNVFTDKEIGSNEKISLDLRKEIKILWSSLEKLANVKVFNGRFPSESKIKKEVKDFNPDILGCHLSHTISAEVLNKTQIFVVATSTAGYNHIYRIEEDDILITHTPGVLHETVADYTVALIMANLRNLLELHNYVWNGNWTPNDKWDLDQSLSSIISEKILGIVGMGEIGKSVVSKLYPWGVKVLYYDIHQKLDFEEDYPSIEVKEKIEDIFRNSDIISIHVPLNKETENLIDKNLLKLMKKDSLLINTARGGVLDLEALIYMLENKEIQINIAFDVFLQEPIDSKTLARLKKIKSSQPNIRMILLPHNASADANTRAKMNILFLKDIIKIIESSTIEDLNEVHIIPEQKTLLEEKNWRIYNYWGKK
jgi:glyoxylate reductase